MVAKARGRGGGGRGKGRKGTRGKIEGEKPEEEIAHVNAQNEGLKPEVKGRTRASHRVIERESKNDAQDGNRVETTAEKRVAGARSRRKVKETTETQTESEQGKFKKVGEQEGDLEAKTERGGNLRPTRNTARKVKYTESDEGDDDSDDDYKMSEESDGNEKEEAGDESESREGVRRKGRRKGKKEEEEEEEEEEETQGEEEEYESESSEEKYTKNRKRGRIASTPSPAKRKRQRVGGSGQARSRAPVQEKSKEHTSDDEPLKNTPRKRKFRKRVIEKSSSEGESETEDRKEDFEGKELKEKKGNERGNEEGEEKEEEDGEWVKSTAKKVRRLSRMVLDSSSEEEERDMKGVKRDRMEVGEEGGGEEMIEEGGFNRRKKTGNVTEVVTPTVEKVGNVNENVEFTDKMMETNEGNEGALTDTGEGVEIKKVNVCVDEMNGKRVKVADRRENTENEMAKMEEGDVSQNKEMRGDVDEETREEIVISKEKIEGTSGTMEQTNEGKSDEMNDSNRKHTIAHGDGETGAVQTWKAESKNPENVTPSTENTTKNHDGTKVTPNMLIADLFPESLEPPAPQSENVPGIPVISEQELIKDLFSDDETAVKRTVNAKIQDNTVMSGNSEWEALQDLFSDEENVVIRVSGQKGEDAEIPLSELKRQAQQSADKTPQKKNGKGSGSSYEPSESEEEMPVIRRTPHKRHMTRPGKVNRAVYEANYYNTETVDDEDSEDLDAFIADDHEVETASSEDSDSSTDRRRKKSKGGRKKRKRETSSEEDSESDRGGKKSRAAKKQGKKRRKKDTSSEEEEEESNEESGNKKQPQAKIENSSSDEEFVPKKIGKGGSQHIQTPQKTVSRGEDKSETEIEGGDGGLRASQRIRGVLKEREKISEMARKVKEGFKLSFSEDEEEEEGEEEVEGDGTIQKTIEALLGGGSDEEDDGFIANDAEEDVERETVTCVCRGTKEWGVMVRCKNELCGQKQHLSCVGFKSKKDVPHRYRCPKCNPSAFPSHILNPPESKAKKFLDNLNQEAEDESNTSAEFVDEDDVRKPEYRLWRLLEPNAYWELLEPLLDDEYLNVNWVMGGKSFLHRAASAGLTQAVDKLLARGADANKCDPNTRWLPLHCAVDEGHKECVDRLLKSTLKMWLSRPDEDGNTLLHMAAKHPKADVLNRLLDKKNPGRKALLQCIDKQEKKEKLTPLGVALCDGSTECTEVLLREGADANLLDSTNNSTVHFAAEGGSVACLKMITERVPRHYLNMPDKEGMTPFMLAVQRGHVDAMRYLVGICGVKIIFTTTKDKDTPLHLAAIAGSKEAVDYLVELGHPVAPPDRKGWPPLLHGIFFNKEDSVLTLFKHNTHQLYMLMPLLTVEDEEMRAKNKECVVKVLTLIATVPAYYSALNEFVSNNIEMLENDLKFMLEQRTILSFDNKRRWLERRLAQTRYSRSTNMGHLRLNIDRATFLDSVSHQLETVQAPPITLQVTFNGEEGVARGPIVEMFDVAGNQMLDPDLGLFETAGNSYSYSPCYYLAPQPTQVDRRADAQRRSKLYTTLGKLIGMALVTNHLMPLNFARHVCKLLLGQKVTYEDLQSADSVMYDNFEKLLAADPETVEMMCLSFEATIRDRAGNVVNRELKFGGADIPVTAENRKEYVSLYTQLVISDLIKPQVDDIRRGLYLMVHPTHLAPFSSDEIPLLIMGNQEIDIRDWEAHTSYHEYRPTDAVIRWFWALVAKLTPNERMLLLKFATGTVCVPTGGFKKLVGLHGPEKFTIAKSYSGQHALLTASTCFNRLKLPVYTSYQQLESKVLVAIRHGSEGFAFC